ncbi:MAG TPA: 2-oxo acid dehydrogenase subunit E2, partial [Candidatus Latescibacteria bacterium]|nr:2-oxo acid dehydrogenase subunit E2 [Candidatus Latescibacterota bacterium]
SNIDIRRVPGSGPGGRVVLRDVAAAAAKVLKEPTPSSWEFPRQRSVMVSRLMSSHQEIPTFTVTRTIQMDRALAFRKLQTESGAFPEGLGITELCVAAAARASGAEPRLNARYSDGRVILQETVNIGIAVGLEDLVVVPVIQRCNALTLKRIATEYRRIVAAAKGGSLLPDDARGGTFTVSNLGMLGVEQFSAIINPPEAAILAVGAIRREIYFELDRIEARNVMSVTLTVDHRVADGLHAARWLQEFARALENPGQMLAI